MNREKLFKKYVEAVKVHFPLWFDPHPEAPKIEELFSMTYQDIKTELSVLRGRERNWVRVLLTEEEICTVFSYLLDKFTREILSSNAWWALQEARERGLLDANFSPPVTPVDRKKEER